MIEELRMFPSGQGRFEVLFGDNLIYSKKDTGRHAEAGEVVRLLIEKTGAVAQPRS